MRALIGEAGFTEEQRWRLAASLFGQTGSLLAGALALAVVMGGAWLNTHDSVYSWLGGAGITTVFLRVLTSRLFRARRRRGTPDEWAVAFAVGSGLTASAFGVGAAVSVLVDQNWPARLLCLAVEAGYVAGGTVRNNAAPIAVAAQNLLALGVTAAALLVTGNLYLQAIGGLTILQIASNLEVAQFMGRQTLSLMRNERDAAALNARLQAACEELERANTLLAAQSATDGLTGIANRRCFDERLADEWSRARRSGEPVGLLMIDVDHFKAYNDLYGHLAGDECLRLVAGVLRDVMMRPTDLAARYGGEEFVALLPGTDLAGAREIAERIQAALARLAIPHRGAEFGQLTVSIGVSASNAGSATGPHSLIVATDSALYRAKRGGRNRIAQPVPPLRAA